VREGFATFYQFGCKDALPGINTLSEGSYAFDNTHGGRSLGYGIQHPGNMFIYSGVGGPGSNFYNWCDALYDNLWSANNTTTGYNDDAVIKTIYDPCPVGFKIPSSNAFTGFTINGQTAGTRNIIGTWNKGYTFNNKITAPDTFTHFFALGFRRYDSDVLSGPGSEGTYWSAVPLSVDGVCTLYFTEMLVNPESWIYRSSSSSVRPVAEPKTRVTLKLPGSTEEDWSNNEDLNAGDIDI